MERQAYARMLGRLFAARRGGVKLELGRMQRCLARLGHPEATPRLRVHIAGTNGKGSTVAFVSAMLQASGLRVGSFTSPHLNQLGERFAVDGAPASMARVLAADKRVRGACDGSEPLTFFEHVTAMALCVFDEAKVDVSVLEVGLGGRFDATTAVPCEVAAVTGVAMDHQDYLGHTLELICAEKAAVFRHGQDAIIGAAGRPECVPWLVSAAHEATVSTVSVVDARAMARVPLHVVLGIPGEVQRANAAAALAVVERSLHRLGLTPTAAALERGLADASLAGRLEVVAASPTVIVDGAHNPHAAEALARELRVLAPQGYVLVLGTSAGKDVEHMVRALLPGARLVVATQAESPRSVTWDKLLDLVVASGCDHAEGVADPRDAIQRAREVAGGEGLVVATGSLFLVAHVHRLLCGAQADPIPVTDPV